MSLSVYFDKDIAHVLEAIYLAEEGQTSLLYEQMGKILKDEQQRQALSEQMQTYQRGYCDALLAVAMAFGVVDQSQAHVNVAHGTTTPLVSSRPRFLLENYEKN